MKTLWIGAAALLLVLQSDARGGDTTAEQMLEAHNRYRAEVKVPPLTWSTQLAERAQKWAQGLIDRNAWAHQGGEFGENLFEVSGGPGTPASVVNAWVSERSDYDHETNSCRGRCGHYTQVVWRDTKQVGCGVARKDRREVWVCNYSPPGNIVGERPY